MWAPFRPHAGRGGLAVACAASRTRESMRVGGSRKFLRGSRGRKRRHLHHWPLRHLGASQRPFADCGRPLDDRRTQARRPPPRPAGHLVAKSIWNRDHSPWAGRRKADGSSTGRKPSRRPAHRPGHSWHSRGLCSVLRPTSLDAFWWRHAGDTKRLPDGPGLHPSTCRRNPQS